MIDAIVTILCFLSLQQAHICQLASPPRPAVASYYPDITLYAGTLCYDYPEDASAAINDLLQKAAVLQQSTSPSSLAGAMSEYGALVEIRFTPGSICNLQHAIVVEGRNFILSGGYFMSEYSGSAIIFNSTQ